MQVLMEVILKKNLNVLYKVCTFLNYAGVDSMQLLVQNLCCFLWVFTLVFGFLNGHLMLQEKKFHLFLIRNFHQSA